MLENQDQDLTLTDLSHNTLSYQLSQNLNLHHQNPVMIKDIIYYNYAKTEPQTVQVINPSMSKSLLSQDIMSPSSNSSSSPASVSINPVLKQHSFESHDMANSKAHKKSQKKKSTQVTSEIDEERTSQLVSEILKNIKEKTKELESLNQNLKSTSTSLGEQKSSIKINNVSDDYSKTFSQDSFDMNDSNDFYDSDGSRSQTKIQKQKVKKITKLKSNSKKLLEIPAGWLRQFDLDKSIVYVSPSGLRLKTHQELKSYLLSDQTCKCGLECPLNIFETFNFSPLIENVSATAPSKRKTACMCKHVAHGIKKQKNLVKVLDEVQPNQKASKKGLTSKKAKATSQTTSETYIQQQLQNADMLDQQQQQHQQEQHQPILISNLILSSDNFNSNDLIFDTKNFTFSQSNQFNPVEINSYTQADNSMSSVNHDSNNLNFSQDFNGIINNKCKSMLNVKISCKLLSPSSPNCRQHVFTSKCF